MRAAAPWLLIALTALAAPLRAEPLIELQRAERLAATQAETREHARERMHQDKLAVVTRLAKTAADDARTRVALAAAEQREQNAAIGALQAATALRRARQDLNEAVNDAVEQGDAIERAAMRAVRGEVAPSAKDLLACDGPDCVTIPLREHAAMIAMGAVPAGFDMNTWKTEGAAASITALAPNSAEPRLAFLRQAAADIAGIARDAQARAAAAFRAMAGDASSPATLAAFVQAQAEADTTHAQQAAAEQTLQRALRGYADAGRALKRAALLAGDGYTLAHGGRKACSPTACVSAEGLEAAAFLVIGAAEDMSDGTKSLTSYVAKSAGNAFVFH